MKKPYPHPSWIEIDLRALQNNIHILRSYSGAPYFCLPVKCNAYGHGLYEVAKAAEEIGVEYVGVSCLQEAAHLREAGIKTPILVLGAIHEDQMEDLIQLNVDITLSSQFKADLLAKSCNRLGKRCRVHLEVDTGMQRTGVRPETAIRLFLHLKALGWFDVVGIYSHLATANARDDANTFHQIEVFKKLRDHPVFQGESLLWHLANSGAVLHFSKAHEQMIRPGILTFGVVPENAPPPLQKIAPCFTLKSKVSYFKVVPQGQGISYGHTYVTSKKTRIVTVPIGYGDGYRRALSGKGSVLIRNKKFPIAGMICMDQFMVDVGEEEVHVGDEVVLIGKQGDLEIKVEEVAQLCDTIPYEIFCGFTQRVPRVYVRSQCKELSQCSLP